MKSVDEGKKQASDLAREVLRLTRNTLLVSLRFLDASLHQLRPQEVEEVGTMAVDGLHLFYNPWHILRIYKEEKEAPIRDYLHILHHCLFHHMFVNMAVHQGCWDLACDIAAENAITGLELGITASARQFQQAEIVASLQKKLKLMTAEKIYRHYLDQNLSDEQLVSIRAIFQADDHEIWYKPPEREKQRGKTDRMEKGENSEDGQASDGKLGEDNEAPGEGNPNGDSAKQQPLTKEELAALWKQISERAQVDLETASRQWGDQKGGLLQSLNQVNREKYDYASFLQRFAILGEVMQINMDEFDLVFYTYGLRLYGNLPLIEPLEYRDVKRVKEFVIAIDTSGSVQGKTVQAFIQKTYNLLKQSESFFSSVNIHIIQCDTDVQEDHKITCAEDFDQYLRTMELRGFGGTDFRPVFTYVDELARKKEFENLKGLIYFTDGYGIFPEKKPAYDTAFVFLDEDYLETPVVPPWAIKLVLSSDDVVDKE